MFYEICYQMQTIISDLSPSQIHIFFEALGCMISASGEKDVEEKLIGLAMRDPNAMVRETYKFY